MPTAALATMDKLAKADVPAASILSREGPVGRYGVGGPGPGPLAGKDRPTPKKRILFE